MDEVGKYPNERHPFTGLLRGNIMTILKAHDSILKANGKILKKGKIVVIGGRAYPFIQIGRQLWITENLDYKWEGLVIATTTVTTPVANYYNQDENLWGFEGRKCGLLYNWYAVDYLENNKNTLLPSGWRVPKVEDYNAMLSSLGISNNLTSFKALACLKDENLWVNNAWNGENTSQLNIKPAGIFDNAIFDHACNSSSIWTADSASSERAPMFLLSGVVYNNDPYVSIQPSTNKLIYRPVRLVKDV